MASFTEYPDAHALSKIVRHKEIYDDQRSLLESYLRKAQTGSVEINYDYKHRDDEGNGFGRIYPTPYCLNATYQWNKVRSTLYQDSELDIDIVNSQLSILLGFCQQLENIKGDDGRYIMNPNDFKSLREYVENRQEIINSIFINPTAIERYNKENNDNRTKKDFVKTLVIMLCFGSTVGNWAKSFGLRNGEFDLLTWVKDFESELIYIATTVVNHNPKKDFAIKTWRNKEYKKRAEKKGKSLTSKEKESIENNYKKILALILQDKETEICLDAIIHLTNRGFTVTSYIYDGFQIKNNQGFSQKHLDEIENTEFNCKFIIKPFCEPLNLDDEYLLPEPPTWFRPELMNSLGFNNGKATTDAQALAQKEYFEEFFCYLEGSNKFCEFNSGKMYYHSASAGPQRFSNCFIYKEDKNGNVKQTLWWKHWEMLSNRRSYRSIEVLPHPLPCPKNVLNLWDGWPIEKISLDESVSYKPILDLFRTVCGNDNDVVEYLLNWFALKVQKPGQKTLVAIVLYTQEEGTGKTSLAEGIMSAFLQEKSRDYLMATTQIDDVVGKFTTAGEKLLTVVNEMNLADSIRVMNPLKSFITDNTFHKEIKGVMAESVPNISELICTTNNPNAVKISNEDRRFQVIEPDGSVANNTDFFKPIHMALQDDKVMRHFFEFLKNRDISDFVPSRDRIITKIQKEFKINSLSTIQEYFIDLYKDDDFDRMKEYTYRDLYDKYVIYCSNNGKSDKVVPDRKYSMLVKKQIKGYDTKQVKRGGKKVHIVKFDWEVLGEWVKDNSMDDDDTSDNYGDSGMGDSEEECDDI
jgi:hypothetical protein